MPCRIDSSELSFHLLSLLFQRVETRVLLELGFPAQEISHLRGLNPRQLNHLARFGHLYLQLTLDPPGFCQALERVREQQEIERLQERFIRHQAPAVMMRQLFGMNRNEFAACRQRLGIHRGGRPHTLQEAQVDWLYRRWSEIGRLPPLRRYLLLVEESGLSLATLWPVIRTFPADTALTGTGTGAVPARGGVS